MKNTLMLLTLLSWTTFANADLMSPERSRCLSMQSVAESYHKWQSDFQKYRLEEAQLDEPLKYQREFIALNSLVDKVKDLKRLSLFTDRDAKLEEGKHLIQTSSLLARPYAISAMKTEMSQLADRMDSLIYTAQVKYDCQLEKSEANLKLNAGPSAAIGER